MPDSATSSQSPVSTEEDMVDQGLYVSIQTVQQAIAFLDDASLTQEQLTYKSHAIPGGTIGKHIRHAADHYQLLLKAVSESTSSEPCILSYDVRERNTAVEHSPAAARNTLLGLIEMLKEIVPSIPMDTPITLKAVTPFPASMSTSFARELWFSSLHAIHHWSMVRVIAGEQDISVDDSFGVAPSTLMFRSRSQQPRL